MWEEEFPLHIKVHRAPLGFPQPIGEGRNNQCFLHWMKKKNVGKNLPRNTIAQEEVTWKPNQG
jgi:hypothetical protein